MTALADLSALVNRATGGNSGTPVPYAFFKDARIAGAAPTAPVVGRWTSLWLYDGQPGATTAPGAVAIPDNTTAGGMQQTDPGGSRQLFATGLVASGLTAGTLMLYDRLLHISGLNGTTLTAQAVQGGTAGSRTPALTRYTDGLGNIAFIEIYTAIGASATTVLMTYDDQTNTESTGALTAIGNTGLNEAARMIPLPLAAGDYAVRGIKEVDLTATTSTAGNFGATLAHPLAYVHIPGGGLQGKVDWVGGQIPEIKTDACLAWAWHAGTTTVPQVFGNLQVLES